MKFTCAKDSLNQAINIAQKAVANKATLEILEYILLIADETGLKLRSNNLQIAIETVVEDVQIEQTGSVCLESRMFGEIVKNLPNGTVEIAIDEAFEATIKASKSKFKLKGLDGKDFPKMREVGEELGFELKVEDFNDMIRKTSFSVAKDDAKPVITGELFSVKNKKINVVSLDGFRISHVSREIETDGEFEVVIPGTALNEVSKILPTNPEEKLTILLNNEHIKFKNDKFILVTSLINGDFLKYETMFIDTYLTQITISRQEFERALRRTMIISQESKSRTPVKFNIKDDNIILTSNGNIVDFYEEVPCNQAGENMEIGFNPKYILEAISVMEDDKVQVSFNGQLNPCIIRGVEKKDCEYLVLPLRLQK